MKKKLYIQPNTDFVRMANGEPLMEAIGGGLPSSGSAGEPGKAPANIGGPAKKINVMYI